MQERVLVLDPDGETPLCLGCYLLSVQEQFLRDDAAELAFEK